MKLLLLIRYAALIVMRDVLIPGGGLYLAMWGPPGGGPLEPWHLPLIAGMLGTPLIGRGQDPPTSP